jgi:hypothetical protein
VLCSYQFHCVLLFHCVISCLRFMMIVHVCIHCNMLWSLQHKIFVNLLNFVLSDNNYNNYAASRSKLPSCLQNSIHWLIWAQSTPRILICMIDESNFRHTSALISGCGAPFTSVYSSLQVTSWYE